jgi:hypothetical protein
MPFPFPTAVTGSTCRGFRIRDALLFHPQRAGRTGRLAAGADLLKAACARLGLHADPARTADCASILRPPGTYNKKSSPPFMVIGGGSGEPIALGFFIEQVSASCDGLRPASAHDRLSAAAAHEEARRPLYSDAEVLRFRSALAVIPADERETWFRIGAALHWLSESEGWDADLTFAIWTEWSRKSKKFDEADQRTTWESFGRGYNGQPIILGTLFHIAKAHGWAPPAGLPDAADVTAHLEPGAEGEADAEAAEITRLAALSVIQYEHERTAAAQRLGYRAKTLDKLVAAARDGNNGERLQGSALDLPSPEPWPEPVDGDAVLDELATLLTDHVVMAREGAHATALWILHAWLLDQAQMNPRLLIKSPEKQCGKTTLLSLMSRLVPRPLPASNIPPAAVYRAIDAAHPVLLIDEADALFAGSAKTRTPEAEALRGIVNSGHTRALAYVVRVEGESHEPRKFSTWAAMALAAIGRLPGTIEDRSIAIGLRRRLPGEKIARFRQDREDEVMRDAARRAARWALDNAAALGHLEPEVPPELQDRVADNWRPLLTIADAAGGDWPERAREAAVALAREGAADRASIGTTLLSDIRAIFRKKDSDRLSSVELTDALGALEDRPWAEWGRSGKPLTKNGLAALLQKFRIEPKGIRLKDGHTPRGYTLKAFEDAFARYLEAEPKGADGGHRE